MQYKPKLSNHDKRPAAIIYAVVFNSAYSLFLVLLLLSSFVIQPVHQALANESSGEENIIVPEVVTADDVTIQSEELSVEEAQLEDTENVTDLSNKAEEQPSEENVNQESDSEDIRVTSTVTNSSEADELPDEETQSSTTNQIPVNLDNDDQQSTSTENSSDQNNSSDSSGSGSDDNNNNSYPNSTSTATSSQDVADFNNDDNSTTSSESNSESDDNLGYEDEDNTETTALEIELDQSTTSTSSNNISLVNNVKAQSLVTEDNFYQFSKQSCVAIGDGTFHCSQSAETGIDLNAVVYAALGKNSNMEIFLKTSKGNIKQLTENNFDDTSPHYSAEAKQIVWQRLVDDRYQVILYDIEEETEIQLTFSRTNNMEPKVSEEGVVWQAWDGNDWEIMLFDGKYTDQLTDNLTQDVAPAIDDGYVLWSVLGEDDQEARVYSLESDEVLTINGYEGGVITNPRFVLVYDTQFENGDVVTQGFDPTTGLSAPIAAKPAENPVNIPDTDSTGETRALIQNKTSQKDGHNPDGTKNVTGSSTPNALTNGSTTTDSTVTTLDLTSQTNDIASTTDIDLEQEVGTTTNRVEEPMELTDFDLILSPKDESGPESTSSTTSSST